jgi:hypothetical protein
MDKTKRDCDCNPQIIKCDCQCHINGEMGHHCCNPHNNVHSIINEINVLVNEELELYREENNPNEYMAISYFGRKLLNKISLLTK